MTMKGKNKNHGFTLIEVSLAVFIVSVLVITILGMFSYALRVVSENKLLVQATTLEEEKMELIKNLPYNSVGTVGGIPVGTLPQNETVVVNNTSYTISTFIVYIDDPADGILGVDPSELFGTDYKKVRIQISWNGPMGSQSQTLITNISPKRNQNIPGTGTLSIIVFNANGQAVPQAEVHIKATFPTTTVDIVSQTNNQGRLILPGAKAGLNAYSIVTTKTNYSTDRTCSIDAVGQGCTDAIGNPVPTKPNASVIEGDYTEVSFAIDLLSAMNVKTIRQPLPTEWKASNDATFFDQDNPSMATCSNGNYIFTWRDYRQNNNPRIYAQMFDQNRVAQWIPDLAITTSNNQNNPDIATDANCNIYVVWNDDRNGNQDIYFEKYNSLSTSVWGGAKKVDTQANSADQTFPQVMVNASSTFEYMVWMDTRNDPSDIYAQKFNPLGNAVWANEIRINSDATTAAQSVPKIQADKMLADGNENIYFVWYDNRNSNNDIFIQKYDKNGAKIYPSDFIVNTDIGSSDQKNPDFALARDGNLYMVWQDLKNGNYDIYAQKFDNTGTKLWAEDIKINSDTETAAQEKPVITEDNSGNFYIVWEDSRNGTIDIYMQKIDANGAKLINFDTRINSNTANEQGNPDIFINNDGYLTIAWQDNKSGNFDIMSTVYTGDPAAITNVGNVPINIKGAKRIGENPVIYKYNNNYATNATGDLAITNLEWDEYTLTPTGYTLLVTEPPQPIALNPNQTINIILNLQ